MPEGPIISMFCFTPDPDGHAVASGGVVTMWSPNVNKPLVRMLCHHGGVNALTFDSTGHYMITSGGACKKKGAYENYWLP